MNSSSEDDKPLTEFLKQYQPVVPPASADLEDRIMATIATTISPEEFVRRDRDQSAGTTQRRKVWLIPSAIAAGMIATVIGYRTFAPAPQPSPAEAAELEAFIESSWSNAVASDAAVDHTYELLLKGDDVSTAK
jgi:hypothetical protein